MAMYAINKVVNTSNSKKTWSAAYISSARPRAEHTVNRKTLKETFEPTLHSSSSQQPTLQVTSLNRPQLIISRLQPNWLVQEFSTQVALSFFLKTLIHMLVISYCMAVPQILVLVAFQSALFTVVFSARTLIALQSRH